MKKGTWLDISEEMFREYIYPSGSIVRIDEPSTLMISESSLGGHAHRVSTKDGYGYYVAPGWSAIRWTVSTGPVFKI